MARVTATKAAESLGKVRAANEMLNTMGSSPMVEMAKSIGSACERCHEVLLEVIAERDALLAEKAAWARA